MGGGAEEGPLEGNLHPVQLYYELQYHTVYHSYRSARILLLNMGIGLRISDGDETNSKSGY